MNNDTNNPSQENESLVRSRNSQENDSQRLHRLVLPMILDILRDRRRPFSSLHNHQDHSIVHDADDVGPPALLDDDEIMSDHTLPPSEPSTVNMPLEEPQDVNRMTDATLPLEEDRPQTINQQGQLIPATLNSPSSRRPRYRLVVYFEERPEDAMDSSEDGELSPTRVNSARPSRYVAVFSIDSDAQNMPIIHSAGLQNSAANFDDLLNQLFTSYVPKGTPPAKKEIIDSLPESVFTSDCATQPKCAICLEDFEEGVEMVELPCSHRFHGEACVKPWLRMHSSCPVCRYEMPVDDIEYEQTRKERMASRNLSQDLDHVQA